MLFGAISTGIIFLCAEGTLRQIQAEFYHPHRGTPADLVEAVAAMGWEPNAADRRLLRTDPKTLWAPVPGFEDTLPSYVAGGAPWTVKIGAHGFRGLPLSEDRDDGRPRIACVGNSCTFGLLVDEGRTYPDQLRQWLRERGHDVDVASFSVPGFTSEQGKILLRDSVLPHGPDIVVIAFGFNDAWPALESDEARLNRHRSASGRVRRVLETLESFRLLEYALRGRGPSAARAPDTPGTRVPTDRMTANLRDMIAACRASGATPILLGLDFRSGDRVPQLESVARSEGVPFLDARPLLAGIAPPLPNLPTLFRDRRDGEGPHETVVFEVSVPSHIERPISIVGTAPGLGGGRPGTVLVPDDGVPPDSEAGDGIHTLRTTLVMGDTIRFAYQAGAEPGSWAGLESPATCREWVAEAGRIRHRFATLPVMAEPIHPSATGYIGVALAVGSLLEDQFLMPVAPSALDE